MDIEHSLWAFSLPLCWTPYRMTLGKWNSWKHLRLNFLGSSFIDFLQVFKLTIWLVLYLYLLYCKAPPDLWKALRYISDILLDRLSMTFTVNGKRQKWNFCRLSSAVCTVEWNYLFLQWIVVDATPFFVCFIYGLKEKNSKSEVIFAVCR